MIWVGTNSVLPKTYGLGGGMDYEGYGLGGSRLYHHCQEFQLLVLAEQFAWVWCPTLEAGHFNVSWVNNFLSGRQW